MLQTLLLVLSIIVFSSATTAQAEIAQNDKTYEGGDLIDLPNAKGTLSIPFSWVGKVHPTTHHLEVVNIMQPTQKVGVQDKGENYNDAIQKATQPLVLTNGMKIYPSGAPQALTGEHTGTIFFYSQQVTSNQQINAVSIITKTPSGKAIEFKSGALNQSKQALTQSIQIVMKNLTFTAHTPTATHLTLPQNTHINYKIFTQDKKMSKITGNPDWRTYLKGKYFFYIKGNSYGSFNQKKIMLCSDGTFWTSSTSSGYSSSAGASVAYSSQQPSNDGYWKAYNLKQKYPDGTSHGTLIFHFRNGSERKITLGSSEDSGVYFNRTYYRYEGIANNCLD